MFYKDKYRKKFNIILIVCLFSGLFSGCAATSPDSFTSQEQVNLEKTSQEKTLVESATDMPQLAQVTMGSIENSEYYDGEINPYMEVLQFPEKGVFEEFRVSLGDRVSAGQVIAVTQPEYEEEIEELEDAINDLQTEYTNAVTNFDMQLKTNAWKAGQLREVIEGMDSEAEGFDDICISFELLLTEGEKIEVQKRQYIEKAEKEIAFQEEKLARLQKKNGANVITAPSDGVITYLADLKVGDEVTVNSYPAALADDTLCLVQCEYFSEAQISEMEQIYAIKDGKKFSLIYYPYKEGDFERKSAKGEGVYTFFEVENADERISFGEDIKVVMVKESRENVLILPANCIRRDGDKCFVYRYEDGRRVSVSVEIGISDELNTEILSGIGEGDRIYVSN